MTDDDITVKVAAIRKELKDGRTSDSTRSADQDSDGHPSTSDQSKRRTRKELRPDDKSDVGRNGPTGSTSGRFSEIAFRERSTGGRHGSASVGFNPNSLDVGSSNATRGGRLVRDDEVKQRGEETEKQAAVKRGRPPKIAVDTPRSSNPFPNFLKTTIAPVGVDYAKDGFERKNQIKFPWFKEGKTLSEQEARNLEEPLKEAIKDDSTYVDEYLWYRTKDPTRQPIWSDLDDEEVAKLAKMLLKQGRKNAVAASTVRNIVSGADYLSALAIVVPRTIKTVDALKTAPEPTRRRLFQNRLVPIESR